MFSELVARNSRRSRRENGLFFTSLLISIVAFYIILSLSHQDVMVFLQRMESSAVDRLLSLVPVLYGLTLFILFFLVYYANRFQLARRRHEFGVYLMLGMQRRKLFGMLLAEDLRSSLIALAIGLPAALLISEVISLVTARLVGLGIVGHRFTLSLSAIGWTAVGFLAIKLLASLILSGKIVREEIGALLTETPEGTKKQRPAAVYAAALVLGTALLAGAYTFAILGYAWSGLRYMAGTIALGVAGTLLLFYGLRVIIDRLARRGDRAGRLRVFNFRQVEETVIHRSGALAICSLLILAALCCFGAGVATARSSRAETHTLDYTFPTDSEDSSAVRDTLAAHGLDGAFSDLFEMRIGRVRTSTDYQNTVKFPALQRTIDAMPVSDEQQQLQYMLEAVGYPYLIALSSYNRLLTTAGLPELTLADNEAAVYCDSEVSLASRTALINRLIAEGSSITIDGAPFTLCGQVQSVSVVTDRSITMSFALIVPDAVFDHYTQGDYDVYLDGVLAPSMTEGKSLMNAIADMNALLDPTRPEIRELPAESRPRAVLHRRGKLPDHLPRHHLPRRGQHHHRRAVSHGPAEGRAPLPDARASRCGARHALPRGKDADQLVFWSAGRRGGSQQPVWRARALFRHSLRQRAERHGGNDDRRRCYDFAAVCGRMAVHGGRQAVQQPVSAGADGAGT